MQDFFRLLLPESGWKFVVTIKDGVTSHHPCTTFDEMESKAAAASAEGIDAYFACASFAAAQYVDETGKKRARTGANAVATKSFWLDIDVGESKPYATREVAVEQLRAFCEAHGLPRPMLVSSGAGLHCYWPMTGDVPKADWQPVAAKLKAITSHAVPQLHVDQSRTSDVASVLRPVQTLNYKRDRDGEPVTLLAAVKPGTFEAFCSAIDTAFAKIAPRTGSPNTSSPPAVPNYSADIAEIEDALRFIDPDRGDRSDWWLPLAAIADALGEKGRETARIWSRGDLRGMASDRYDAAEFDAQFSDCLARRNLAGNRVGVGTIIRLAREGGWTGGTPDWVRDLNDEYAWIEQVSAIYRHRFNDFITPANFRQQLANQFVEVSSGEATKRVSAGDAWLKHPRRREHEALVMRPGSPAVTHDNRLNTWQGFSVEPAPGDVTPFLDLFGRLISDPDAGVWVMLWLAHLLQRPHIKMNTALVIWSREQGVGKNLLFECFRDIIGKRHATLIGQADVDRDFNGWVRDKILVIGDEVIGQDRRQHADKLKGLITGATIQINEKHQPVVELPNLANFIFLSNHPNAVFIGDDDRRYFVWEIEAGRLSPSESKVFTGWRDDGGLNALLSHFQSIDLADFDPKANAPSTAAKRMMIEDNRSDFEVWAEQLIASGARNILGREMATASELADRYRYERGVTVSIRTVTTTLKRMGCNQREHQVRLGHLKVRPIALDRLDHWRRQPEGSWAAEMCKPLTRLGLPQQCLTTALTQKPDLQVVSQERAA